ncbi:MAG: hypothetical protein LBP63_01055 [Prevotellaceae bacterium]|jgi:hypothetical protein|nr:hypothetical protein [Prevotellaceae bacterium]
MKKIMFILVAFIGLGICTSARTPQDGKYCCTDNSYVIVDGDDISLYIDGYSAGKFTITHSEDTDDPNSMWFTFVSDGGKENNGEYKKINGEFILKLGNRTLKKSNC